MTRTSTIALALLLAAALTTSVAPALAALFTEPAIAFGSGIALLAEALGGAL